jgi:hypothetical protein
MIYRATGKFRRAMLHRSWRKYTLAVRLWPPCLVQIALRTLPFSGV